MDKLEYFSGIPEVGIVPRAPHAGPLLRHVYEQEHGRGGFAGKVSHTYHHKNLDYLETIGYHFGEFFSRGGVFREGMVSVHPVGLPHGPHPPALRAFLDGRRPETFDEVGIMADFATPARISELALGSSRKDYMQSWAAYATDPRFRFSETRLHEVRRLADRLSGERDRLRPAPLDDEDGQ